MSNLDQPTTSDSRVRRAARKVGLIARKSRWRRGTIENFGGFALVDPLRNTFVAGSRFDLTADEALSWCAHRQEGRGP